MIQNSLNYCHWHHFSLTDKISFKYNPHAPIWYNSFPSFFSSVTVHMILTWDTLCQMEGDSSLSRVSLSSYPCVSCHIPARSGLRTGGPGIKGLSQLTLTHYLLQMSYFSLLLTATISYLCRCFTDTGKTRVFCMLFQYWQWGLLTIL